MATTLSIFHRLKSLLSEFGERGPQYLAVFSSLAAESGHRSWKRHADDDLELAEDWQSHGSQEPNFGGAATLIIRMKSAFGTGAKSDVLSYLVSRRDSTSTVASISRAVGYTKTSVRDALTDIVRSGLANESSDWPAEYSTNNQAWKELLRIQSGHGELIHRWCLWIQIFGFLSLVKELIEESESSGMNEHLIVSKSRDIADHYKNAFLYHGLFVPEHASYPGKEYAEGFLKLCRSLAEWIENDIHVKESK